MQRSRFLLRRITGRAGDDRGANLVEFALLAIPFLLLTLGLIDFGRAIFAYNALSHGTKEGARWAIVNGAASGVNATGAQIQDKVRAVAVGLTQNQVTVAVSWDPPNNKNPGSKVKLNSTYTFQPLTTLVLQAPITLRSRSEMVIAR